MFGRFTPTFLLSWYLFCRPSAAIHSSPKSKHLIHWSREVSNILYYFLFSSWIRILIIFLFLVKLFFLSLVEVGLLFFFPKRSRRNYIPYFWNKVYNLLLLNYTFKEKKKKKKQGRYLITLFCTFLANGYIYILILHGISGLNASTSVNCGWWRKAYKTNINSEGRSGWTDQTPSDG